MSLAGAFSCAGTPADKETMRKEDGALVGAVPCLPSQGKVCKALLRVQQGSTGVVWPERHAGASLKH